MSSQLTALLLAVPYAAAILLWLKCMHFLSQHSIHLRAVAKSGSAHRTAFPVACFVTLAANVGVAVVAQGKTGGMGLFLPLLTCSLALNLYLAYAILFHGAWVVTAVFRFENGSDATGRLQASFAQHQKHKRFLRICFSIVATLFAVSLALIANTVRRAILSLP
jgi:hypothetical protein